MVWAENKKFESKNKQYFFEVCVKIKVENKDLKSTSNLVEFPVAILNFNENLLPPFTI